MERRISKQIISFQYWSSMLLMLTFFIFFIILQVKNKILNRYAKNKKNVNNIRTILRQPQLIDLWNVHRLRKKTDSSQITVSHTTPNHLRYTGRNDCTDDMLFYFFVHLHQNCIYLRRTINFKKWCVLN